jgi:hypothetical protein
MNNTQKLDDIRQRIETRLDVLQRVNVVMFERVTGNVLYRAATAASRVRIWACSCRPECALGLPAGTRHLLRVGGGLF